MTKIYLFAGSYMEFFTDPTCPLDRSKVVTLKEGAAIRYRGETGIFRSIKNVVECGGGHGEGRWMMPLFVLVTLDYRVIRIEDGISNKEAVEVLN